MTTLSSSSSCSNHLRFFSILAVFQGLDTMAPVLTLGNGLKLIGEYEETMGSVLIFSESGAFPVTFFLC
jgi:hypothetical protein